MLTGKVAIVTGASRGIGQAVALELARGGAATLLAARTDEACEPVATAIRSGEGRAETISCDVSR
jgi:NAD(P)-dependent dehydrogenase (short-subunit alcohol dehydrogenase family)